MKVEKHNKWRKSFPHYKVQYWDYKINAWHDIQKAFSTRADAIKHGTAVSSRFRIMEVTKESRKPL